MDPIPPLKPCVIMPVPPPTHPSDKINTFQQEINIFRQEIRILPWESRIVPLKTDLGHALAVAGVGQHFGQHSVIAMMSFAFKMIVFVFKMMDFARLALSRHSNTCCENQKQQKSTGNQSMLIGMGEFNKISMTNPWDMSPARSLAGARCCFIINSTFFNRKSTFFCRKSGFFH